MVNSPGKLLIVAGFVLIVAGLFWQYGIKFLPLGKLPGDVAIEKENFRFYFPLASSILVSIALSLIFYLFRFFK